VFEKAFTNIDEIIDTGALDARKKALLHQAFSGVL
jgi:hypothetical protein